MLPQVDSYTKESYNKKSKINVFDLVSYPAIYEQIENASPDVKAYEMAPFNCSQKHKRHIVSDSVTDICDMISAICTNNSKNFILAYYDKPDSILHKFGTNSIEAKNFILESEKIIENMASNLEGTNTLLIISADHGHNDIKNVYSTLDLGELNDFLIMPPSLESRAITFWVKPDKKEEFAQIFNDKFKDEFILLDKQEFLDKHFLGFGNKHKKIDDFLGDFIAISISNSIIKLETNLSSEIPEKLSTHCGITENEMVVPLIIKSIK